MFFLCEFDGPEAPNKQSSHEEGQMGLRLRFALTALTKLAKGRLMTKDWYIQTYSEESSVCLTFHTMLAKMVFNIAAFHSEYGKTIRWDETFCGCPLDKVKLTSLSPLVHWVPVAEHPSQVISPIDGLSPWFNIAESAEKPQTIVLDSDKPPKLGPMMFTDSPTLSDSRLSVRCAET